MVDNFKSFFAYMTSFATQDGVTRIGLLPLDTLAYAFFKGILIVKFRMCEHNIQCDSEKIVTADLKT